MPDTIASCCSDPRRPRTAGGATSAMYAGAMTDAAPTPSPPRTRQAMRSHGPNAKPDPRALTRNNTAASTITPVRPQRSASRPAR